MPTQRPDRERERYELARWIVRRHYQQRLTLALLAEALHCSPRAIQRAYNHEGGSFAEDLLAVRLVTARRLLLDAPGLSVMEVAALVGYRHSQHFSRAFRRRYGVSPSHLRAQRGSAV